MNIKAFVTNGGRALINRLMLTGEALEISSARLGSGKLPFSNELEREMNAIKRTTLIEERAEVEVVRCGIREGVYSVAVQVESADIEEELYVWEIGLFAKDGEGPEALVCYVSFSEAPDWIPPSPVAQYVRNYEIGIAVQMENATLNVSPTALVKMGEFIAHVTEYNNPHRVTADHINNGMLDCGYFTEDPTAAHNLDTFSHSVMLVDGNAEGVGIAGDLETHMVDPEAHPNLTVDGNVT